MKNIPLGGFRAKTRSKREVYKALHEMFDQDEIKLSNLDYRGLQYDSFPKQLMELELIAFTEETHEFYLVVQTVKNRIQGDIELLLDLTDNRAEQIYNYHVEVAILLEEKLEDLENEK